MNFLEIKIKASRDTSEALIALLADIGFDSFAETETGIDAYVDNTVYNEVKFKEVISLFPAESIEFSVSVLENKNWNEEWEKNFNPVVISGKCLIRASFHPSDPKIPLEVIINPKMSFGTGHHETTALMAAELLRINLKGRNLLDAGSGTGILAILASKLGASDVIAYDIEDWAFENMQENVNLNSCFNVKVLKGDQTCVPDGKEDFDVILANINKNVLVEDMEFYSRRLRKNGLLIISGFYREDLNDLIIKAEQEKLDFLKEEFNNNWSLSVFQKN